MIYSNTTGIDGTYGSSSIIQNNTIVNNTSYGIVFDPCNVEIINCILWNNNDDLSGGCSATYSCIEDGDGCGTNGNIDSDPCFVDADANDFHLLSNSPCINAGDPNGNYNGQTDIDNQPRVFNGRVDMGADESAWPLDIWEQFKTALRNDDLNTALTFIADAEKKKYTIALTQLRPQFQNMVAGMGDLVLISMDERIAKYEMLHDEGGGVIASFPVYFCKDDKGNWKIYCF